MVWPRRRLKLPAHATHATHVHNTQHMEDIKKHEAHEMHEIHELHEIHEHQGLAETQTHPNNDIEPKRRHRIVYPRDTCLLYHANAKLTITKKSK